MNIVTPYAKILTVDGVSYPTRENGITALQRIEWCGRISHRTEEAQTQDSWQRFIKAVVLEHGDWSIVEHVSVTVDFLVDRGITHELVRHRLFSFTQESTRFVNYEKKMPPSFIQPEAIETKSANEFIWQNAINFAEKAYIALLKGGCSPQIARSVFPNALASRILVSGNLRNWRHFLIMRTTKESHPQMREVTIPLLAEFKEKIPLFFDDIEPNQRQALAIQKTR